jgi:hypothetical protein
MIIHGFAFEIYKTGSSASSASWPPLHKPGSLPFTGTFKKATET